MNLLKIDDTSLVEKTSLSRKLTLGGNTKAYPVYRVRLDQLFYNDQNDRIATWITQYKNDINNTAFSELSREEYNKIIERFIIDSNSAAIEKTKNNIALVNQREPGVILLDGRIIDGNRRFTCLRLLNKNNLIEGYFETVILDADSGDTDQKQIKMLELAIQHGEEQRVDYNLIDLAIGAYHDIVETELLTIDEYVSSTNETVNEVKRRLAAAQLIIEFLEYMDVPKQYHIAREMQVFSLFYEMVPLLKRCETDEARQDLKNSVFSNTMMGAFADQRKYIRSVKAMMDSGLYSSYIKKQNKITEDILAKKKEANIKNKADLDAFVKENEDSTEELQISMERSLLKSKKAQTKSRPSQIVSKSLSMLMDIDTRVVDKLSDQEKDKLSSQLHKLSEAVSLIHSEVDLDEDVIVKEDLSAEKNERTTAYKLGKNNSKDPIVYCVNDDTIITNLSFSLIFSAAKYRENQSESVKCLVCFVNEKYEELTPLQELFCTCGEMTKINFTLNSSASSLKECYLVIKSDNDAFDEAQKIIAFKVNIIFNVEFDF